MKIEIKKFKELNVNELYDILRLRIEVFIMEQETIYCDTDGIDLVASHVSIYHENTLCAYARVIPPGYMHSIYSSIGRIVVNPKLRKQRLGWEIAKNAIEHCIDLYPNTPIIIHAQSHLETFYKSLGFRGSERYFLEDNIPHVEMIYY